MKTKPLVFIIILILFGLLFFIGWGYSILSRKTTDNTPVKTADDQLLAQAISGFSAGVDKMTDKGTLAPWADQGSDSTDIELPSKEELHQNYLEIRKAYYNRDFELYKQYASPLRVWYLENNTRFETEYQGKPLFSRIRVSGADSFVDSLLLCVYKAPLVNYLEPVSVQGDIEEQTSYDFWYVDLETKEKMLVTNSAWKQRVVLNYTIKENGYQQGKGDIYFVYYQGEWRYNFERWENTFTKNSIVTDATIIGKGVTREINVQVPGDNDKNVTIKTGDKIIWKDFYGIVYSIKPSDNYWNSPLIADSSYERQFNDTGHYTYVISDTFKVIFEGEVNVE